LVSGSAVTSASYIFQPPPMIQKKVNVMLSHYMTHVHFSSCANLSEQWFNNFFKQSPHLLSVTMFKAFHITDPTICVLGQNCRQLRQLTLQSYRITDLSVVALSFFCTELRALCLGITVSDNAISWLFSRCNKIHHFRMELSIGVTGRSLEYIHNLGASKNLVEFGIALNEEPDNNLTIPESEVNRRNSELLNRRINNNNNNNIDGVNQIQQDEEEEQQRNINHHDNENDINNNDINLNNEHINEDNNVNINNN